MDVFRTLMRTRRSNLAPDHIGALNLVEIEFAKDQEVLSAWKMLFSHLGTTHPRRDEEKIDGLTEKDKPEIERRNELFGGRLGRERQSLLAKLLHQMARVLGFKIEQLEIFEGGYTPQFYTNVENDAEAIRRYVIDLANGNRVVPIGVIDYRIAPPVVVQGNENQQAAQ
jgi:hypothetical protein